MNQQGHNGTQRTVEDAIWRGLQTWADIQRATEVEPLALNNALKRLVSQQKIELVNERYYPRRRCLLAEHWK